MEKIQNSAIRAALGYRISTPLNVMLAESKLTLLEERAKFTCKCFIRKAIANEKSQTRDTIKRYQSVLKKNQNRKEKLKIINFCVEQELDNDVNHTYNIYSHDYKTLTTSIQVDTILGSSLKTDTQPNESLNKFLSNENACAIYTDGSKIPGSRAVGAACVCPELDIEIKKAIDNNASIFTAECIALSNAMNIALENRHRDFMVFSDSLSAMLSLQSIQFKGKTNPHILEIKKKLNLFLRNNDSGKIQFFWIPSHIGIQGNELADKLAKSATEMDPSESIPIPYTDAYERYKINAIIQTELIIKEQAQIKGKTYFQQYYCKKSIPWYAKRPLRRRFIVTINRCRADHYTLSASLMRIGITDNPKCPCNYEKQDLNHVIWQCPLHDGERVELVKKLEMLKLRLPLNIEMLIAKPNIQACKHICTFFNQCNLSI